MTIVEESLFMENTTNILDKLDAWVDNINNSSISCIEITTDELQELKDWCKAKNLMVPAEGAEIRYRGVLLEVK